jgi:hypothetical protein
VLLFVGLTYPWSPVGYYFTRAFSAVANVGLDLSFHKPDVQVRFAAADPNAPAERAPGEWNVVLSTTDTASGQTSKLPLGVRRIAYVPIATLVGLTLVMPVPRRRRMIIGGVGLLLLLFRVVLAVALPLARHFGAFDRGSVADGVAQIAYYALIEPPNMMYGAPLVTWALLVLLTSPQSAAWLGSWGGGSRKAV